MKGVSGKYDPIQIEEKILQWWTKSNILHKIVALRENQPKFNFLEGPPTVNGFMHVGHARGRAMKDIVIRHKTMSGFDVWRRGGWDTQGLPVELEVEKKIGLHSKKEIEEKIGLEAFVEECKNLVDEYLKHWRLASERLGMSLDFDNAYETRRDSYIESVWSFIKEADNKGLLVEDYKIVPTCPRCETPLSSHEVALGYSTVEDPSIYVKIKLQHNKDTYILIWTTTPWTLPGNEAVTVHSDFEYSTIQVEEEKWILAKKLVDSVMKELGVSYFEELDVVKGSELKGRKYVHPLKNEVPLHSEHDGLYDHSIICGDHVTLLEGTGCVHTSPAHGPEDFEMSKLYGIPVFNPIDVLGRFTEISGKYKDVYVKDADILIIEDLKRKGTLAYSGIIKHEYPLCWRCDAPLIYRADKQWFLKIDPVKKRLIEENNSVRWVPQWAGTNRFGNWLENAEDWCISRSRIWGSPLNIWVCNECDKRIVIGSVDELKSYTKKLPEKFELHRPWIDNVILSCPSCQGEMCRVEYVVDCWLDSGVAHTAGIDSMRNPILLKTLYPYDFITEAIDQTRGWFYSTLVTGVIAHDISPFNSVLCQEHVRDKEGKKMSKSKGNVIWAIDSMNYVGADLLRLYLIMKDHPWDALSFDYNDVDQLRRWISILWNVFVFSSTYMKLDSFEPDKHLPKALEEHMRVEDKWLMSRTQNLIRETTEGLESLHLNKPLRTLLRYITEDLSRFYVRLVRKRTWSERDDPDKLAAYTVLFYALDTLIKLIAPFTPFLSEELYQLFSRESSTTNQESVHMCDWPRVEQKWLNSKLEEDVNVADKIVTGGLKARQKAKLKLRWPIALVYIVPASDEIAGSITRMRSLIEEQINSKEVLILNSDSIPPKCTLQASLNYEKAGTLFKRDVSFIDKALLNISVQTLKDNFIDNGYLELQIDSGKKVRLTPDLIIFSEQVPESLVTTKINEAKIYIDTTRTSELLAESIAREIVRRAQIMRKEMDLRVDEFVELVIQVEEAETFNALQAFTDYVKTEVRAKEIQIIRPDDVFNTQPFYTKIWDIDGENLVVSVKRI